MSGELLPSDYAIVAALLCDIRNALTRSGEHGSAELVHAMLLHCVERRDAGRVEAAELESWLDRGLGGVAGASFIENE